ncbi:MBL fold metallo-hydrolase [Candidatus Woesearchaeota archaeon]|nr:MBL fold metallo-hydrolase [Candidatus Woesearchaeota archaeon]
MEYYVLIKGVHEIKPVNKEDIASMRVAPICCNVVLLKGEQNIIVDTGYHSFGKELVKKLEEHGLKPADIHTVINTHLHFDHIGNNHLFGNSKWVINRGIWYPDSRVDVYENIEDIKIPEVELIDTPGHLEGHTSVVFSCDGKTIVVAGDAVNDYNIINPDLDIESYQKRPGVKESMKKIFLIADVIIPGHGDIIEEDRLRELKKIVDSW